MPPPYEYRSIVWLNRNNQPFEDWLNLHARHWDVFDVRRISGDMDKLVVSMRRPLNSDAPADPPNDETKTVFRRMLDAVLP